MSKIQCMHIAEFRTCECGEKPTLAIIKHIDGHSLYLYTCTAEGCKNQYTNFSAFRNAYKTEQEAEEAWNNIS